MENSGYSGYSGSEVRTLDIRTSIENYLEFPWPYEDESVDDISCVGVIEYVPVN